MNNIYFKKSIDRENIFYLHILEKNISVGEIYEEEILAQKIANATNIKHQFADEQRPFIVYSQEDADYLTNIMNELINKKNGEMEL